ncbi:S8 family peptidase [Lysobacter niastensis]|uniref:S8 family serine peptidase n=1 Tax=Lysobacter niastensis TaxID=380629 RepID=A0ABS0B5E0_9GAMM|nr:S8 family peptidase [Lysobacter niastensis]MBF6024058.1 S8 family serine peptidase [Lysobacter niastensis]
MKISRMTASLLLACACVPAFAAGRVDLSGMKDATGPRAPRFIVKYKNGSAEQLKLAERQRSLDLAVSRTKTRMGAASSAFTGTGNASFKAVSLRGTASGAHVVRASKRMTSTEVQALMNEIAANPNVESVKVDTMMQATAMPNDPVLSSHQIWQYGNGAGGARVTSAWDTGATGAGVVVAVLDTGVTAHTDLVGNLLPGYDFITDKDVSGRADDGRVAGGWDTGDWITSAMGCGSARNSTFHGTHVSGTIAESTNNALNGAGVAPDAKIVPVRVLGHCGGYTSDINDAIVWAAGGHIDGVPDNTTPAEVINMSLGGAHACEVETQSAINQAVSLGATIVIAAGNSNADVSGHSPANCANVVTIGATGSLGQRAGYSNYGTGVDLSAPGGAGTEGVPNGYVWSTHNKGATTPVANPEGDQMVGMTGTSMATPHVAGIVALMQSVAPQPLTPAQIEGLLVSTARPFPAKPDKPVGAGIVDADAAVSAARNWGKPVEGIALTSGVATALPALTMGKSVIYKITVPSGATRLEVLTYSGRGTLAMYAQYEAEPLASKNIGASNRPGTNQTISLGPVAAGTYYLKVQATADTSGALIRATVR